MVQTEKPDKSKPNGDLPKADGLNPQDDPFASKLPSLTDSAKDNIIKESKDAFYNRRRIQISAIPVAIRPEELGKTLLKDFVFEDIFIDARNNAHVLLSTSSEAKKALSFIKGKRFKENILGASYSQNEFLLFIGNISYSLSIEKFRDMLKQYGEIERIFIMHSEETGQSKGYGFVEYKKNSAIAVAKRELAKNHKNLKVELSSAGLFEYYDFQSQTLSVSKFPSNTTSEQIEEIITKHVQVPFCRIPTNTKTGKLEDFALVDCKSPEDAEMLWKKLDGSAINNGHMRIKFNSPGRLASTLFGGQSFKTFTPKVEPKSPQAVKNVRAAGPQARQPRPDNPVRPATYRSPTSSNSQRPFLRPPNGQSPQHPLGMRLPRHSGGPRAPRDPLQLRGPRGPADLRAPVGPRVFRPPGWRPPFRGPRPRLDSPFGQGVRPRPPFRPRGPEMRFRGPIMRPRPPFQEEWTFNDINYEQDEFHDDPSGDGDDHHSSQAIEGSYFEEKGSAPNFPVPKFEDNGDRRQVGFQRGGSFDRNEDHQRMEAFERQRDFSDKQRDFPGRPHDLNPNRDRNQQREFSNEERDFSDQRRDFPGERRDFRDGRRFPDQERDVPDQRRPFAVGSMDARRDFPDRRRDIADHQRDFPHERRDFAEKQREFPGFEEHRRFDGQGEFGIGNSTQDEQRGLASFEDPRKDVGFRGDKDRRDDIQDRGLRPPFGEYERESAFPPRPPRFADNNMQRTEATRPFGHEPPRELQKEPQKPWMRRGPPEREIPPNQPRNDDQRQPLNKQPVINEPHPDKREPFDQRQPGRWQEHNTNEFMHQRNVLPDDGGRRMEIPARPLLQQGKSNQIRPSFNAATVRQEEPKFDARHQPSDRFPHQGTPKPLPEPGKSQGLLQDPAPETMIRLQIALGQPGPRESRPPPLGMAPPRFQSPQPLLQQPQQPPQQPMGNVQPSQVFPRFPWQQPLPQQPPSQQTPQQQSPLQQPPPQQPPFQQPPPQQPPFQQPPPQQPSFQQPQPQQPPFQQPPPQHPPPQQLPTSQPEQYLPPTFPPQHPPLNPNSYFNPAPPVAHAPKTSAQPTTPQYAIAQGPGKQWLEQSTSNPSGPITTTTTFSSNLTGSIPTIPNMPAFHMPAPTVPLLPVASGVQQPARVSNASATASLPASGPPLVAGGIPQANPQLDTYVAAASAAQQYAQYYQQLAKQQESIAQQPTAAGSKEASTLASQATAYAQYYQQYYQHMQQILQITKVPPTSFGQQQQQSSTTVAVSQPSPSVSVQGANQLPAALQLPQSLQAPHQMQQHQLLPASSAMSSLSLQQQRMPPPQWQPQMAPGLLQQPPPQAFGTQPAIHNQQGVPPFPPKTSLPIQGQISSQPQQAWQMHVPPMQQATATGQSPASPFQAVPQRPQIQPLMSQLQQPPRASNPQSPWMPGAAQSTQPPQPQGSAQRLPVQSPQAQTGMNWMFSKTETTDTVQPQHFSKPVLYTAQTAPDQHGDKRQNQSLFPYGVSKRPRY